MYIYNITFNIDADTLDNWKIWFEEVFVLEIQNASFHKKLVVLEVLSRHQSGYTMTLQLHINNVQDFSKFETHKLTILKQESFKIFGDKVMIFDTMLKDISNDFNFK